LLRIMRIPFYSDLRINSFISKNSLSLGALIMAGDIQTENLNAVHPNKLFFFTQPDPSLTLLTNNHERKSWPQGSPKTKSWIISGNSRRDRVSINLQARTFQALEVGLTAVQRNDPKHHIAGTLAPQSYVFFLTDTVRMLTHHLQAQPAVPMAPHPPCSLSNA
jgi:hypothetical protein